MSRSRPSVILTSIIFFFVFQRLFLECSKTTNRKIVPLMCLDTVRRWEKSGSNISDSGLVILGWSRINLHSTEIMEQNIMQRLSYSFSCAYPDYLCTSLSHPISLVASIRVSTRVPFAPNKAALDVKHR